MKHITFNFLRDKNIHASLDSNEIIMKERIKIDIYSNFDIRELQSYSKNNANYRSVSFQKPYKTKDLLLISF